MGTYAARDDHRPVVLVARMHGKGMVMVMPKPRENSPSAPLSSEGRSRALEFASKDFFLKSSKGVQGCLSTFYTL